MNDRKLFLFLTFLPLLMALFFWDLKNDFSSSPKDTAVSELDQLPSSIVDKAKRSQFDETGLRTQKLESPKLSYSSQAKTMMIERPVIHLHGKEANWLASSDRGEYRENEEHLSLSGNVELIQNESGEAKAPIKMRTERLNYDSITQIIDTDQSVLITTEGHVIESLGMRLDLANSVFILTENVKSTHAPIAETAQ